MKSIPNYVLYEEQEISQFPDFLHCETIRARSSIHEWKIRPHRHHGLYQFFWLETGSVDASIEGREYGLTAPAAMLVPPLAVHGFTFAPDTNGWVVTIPRASIEVATEGAAAVAESLSRPLCLDTGSSGWREDGIVDSFADLAREFEGAAPGRQHKLRCLVGLTAIWFMRAAVRRNRQMDEREGAYLRLMRRFLETLESNYTRRLPLAAYAADLGVTTTHLNRVCKAVAGQTASAILQDRTMLEAKRSLAYTSMTVSEIAYMLGFVDPAHFSKFFTAHMGEPPSAFRRQADGGGTEIR